MFLHIGIEIMFPRNPKSSSILLTLQEKAEGMSYNIIFDTSQKATLNQIWV